MYTIKTYNRIASRGLDSFAPGWFHVSDNATNPDAILLRSHKLAQAELPAAVKAVARAGTGVNNIPVLECTRKGIVVFNTPGANANSVKELVLGALILASRNILGGIQFVNSLREVGNAGVLDRKIESEKKQFVGHELSGCSLGIVGLGAIGTSVAQSALALGMDVFGYDPAISVDAAWGIPSRVQRMKDLGTLFSRSDYISLHVPANEQTVGMVDSNLLNQCKPSSVLLNFARPEIVNDTDVVDALNQGVLAKYLTDFPKPVFIGHERIFTTPHLGASTMEAEENCAVMAVRQVGAFLRFGTVENSVNFPAVAMENANAYRIAVTNINVAGILGQLLSIFAVRNINVIDMINKSRNNIAYNLIDIDRYPDSQLLSDIERMGSVINVRALQTGVGRRVNGLGRRFCRILNLNGSIASAIWDESGASLPAIRLAISSPPKMVDVVPLLL